MDKDYSTSLKEIMDQNFGMEEVFGSTALLSSDPDSLFKENLCTNYRVYIAIETN